MSDILEYRFLRATVFAVMVAALTMVPDLSMAQNLDGHGLGIRSQFPCNVPRGPFQPVPPPGNYNYSGCNPIAVGSRATVEIHQLDNWNRTNGAQYQGMQIPLLIEHWVLYGTGRYRQLAGYISDQRNNIHDSTVGVNSLRSKISKFCYVNGPIHTGGANQVISGPSNYDIVDSSTTLAAMLHLEQRDACRLDPACVTRSCPGPTCSVLEDPEEWEWRCDFAINSDWILGGTPKARVTVWSPLTPKLDEIWHGFWSWDTGKNNNFDGLYKLNAYWPPPYMAYSSWDTSEEVFWGTDDYKEQSPVVLYSGAGNLASPPPGSFAWNACLGIVRNSPCPDKCDVCKEPAFGGKDGFHRLDATTTIPMANWAWTAPSTPPLKWAVDRNSFPASQRDIWSSSTKQAIEAWNRTMGYDIYAPSESNIADAHVIVKGSRIDEFPDQIVDLPDIIQEIFRVSEGTFGITIPTGIALKKLLTSCPNDPITSGLQLPVNKVTIFIFHDRAWTWSGCEFRRWDHAPPPGIPPFDNIPARPLIMHELGHALGSDHCNECKETLMASGFKEDECVEYKAVPIEVRDAINCSFSRR